MDTAVLTAAGLIALGLTVAAMGSWIVGLRGHIAALRDEQRRYTYRLLILWRVQQRRPLTDAEQEEAGRMEVESREIARTGEML